MSLLRHQRQRIMAEFGDAGQQRLAESGVAIIGLGGLGSPAALYLAAAGVGRLGLIDDQCVDASNLNRQILYGEADVGQPKAEVAAGRLRMIDERIELEALRQTVGPSNIAGFYQRYDVILDGTDSFETKFLLNDAAVLLRRPLIHGAVLQWGGQVLTVLPGGPCLRCLFGEPPEPEEVQSCEEAGVLGAATGVIGSVQAEEAIKVILGAGTVLSGRIFQHDGLKAQTRITAFSQDPNCPVCSKRPIITSLSSYAQQVSPRGHVLV
jgi:molybdopterin/thiamine biosynthesis adenylyltransferase